MSKRNLALKLALKALTSIDYIPCCTDQTCQKCKATPPLPVQPAPVQEPAPGRNVYEDGDVFERIAAAKKPPLPVQDESEILTIVYQSGYHDGKQAALAGREWNFCERCGKRTRDMTTIHTCTPPQEKNDE
jgi:hypothetical protein